MIHCKDHFDSIAEIASLPTLPGILTHTIRNRIYRSDKKVSISVDQNINDFDNKIVQAIHFNNTRNGTTKAWKGTKQMLVSIFLIIWHQKFHLVFSFFSLGNKKQEQKVICYSIDEEEIAIRCKISFWQRIFRKIMWTISKYWTGFLWSVTSNAWWGNKFPKIFFSDILYKYWAWEKI